MSVSTTVYQTINFLRSLASQMYEEKDFHTPFWGTYKFAADALTPTFNSHLYPPALHDTYDSNWREFIGYVFSNAPSNVI